MGWRTGDHSVTVAEPNSVCSVSRLSRGILMVSSNCYCLYVDSHALAVYLLSWLYNVIFYSFHCSWSQVMCPHHRQLQWPAPANSCPCCIQEKRSSRGWAASAGKIVLCIVTLIKVDWTCLFHVTTATWRMWSSRASWWASGGWWGTWVHECLWMWQWKNMMHVQTWEREYRVTFLSFCV